MYSYQEKWKAVAEEKKKYEETEQVSEPDMAEMSELAE